jgi:hypothetical protein
MMRSSADRPPQVPIAAVNPSSRMPARDTLIPVASDDPPAACNHAAVPAWFVRRIPARTPGGINAPANRECSD